MRVLFRFPQIHLGILFILFFSVYGLLSAIWTFFQQRKRYQKGSVGIYKYVVAVIVSSLGAVFCVFLFGTVLASFLQTADYWPIEKQASVTGYVENYRFQAEGSHDTEAFEVNGVSFSYITDGTAWFYSKTASRGGAIYGDGQYVEIRYVSDSEGKNHILYIAEDTSKSRNVPEENQRPKTSMTILPWIVIGLFVLIGILVFIKRKTYIRNHSDEKTSK